MDCLFNQLRYGVIGNVNSSVGIVISLRQRNRRLIWTALGPTLSVPPSYFPAVRWPEREGEHSISCRG